MGLLGRDVKRKLSRPAPGWEGGEGADQGKLPCIQALSETSPQA